MSQNNEMFKPFQSNKKTLLSLFDEVQSLIDPYKLEEASKTVQDSKARLEQDTFKVLVVGEFKHGKSTFINALLGEEILPAYAAPCTAVINEVKYSEQKRAVLHFKVPIPQKLPDNLTQEVKNHLDKYKKSTNIPPLEIKVEDIEKYVVIQNPGKDRYGSEQEQLERASTPFSKVELFWPLNLCKNGIEIIDSPGLNEHKSRTDITTRYYSKVDTVIFILSSSHLGSASEIEVIDSLRRKGFEDIFFICNRFDEVRPKEKERLTNYAFEILPSRTSLKESGIHFVSSADALDAKLDFHDKKIDKSELTKTLEESGFGQTEEHLIKFLAENRGKIKILQPGRELRNVLIDFIDTKLPNRKKFYEQKYEDLVIQKEKTQPAVKNARRCQRSILRSIELEQKRFADSATRSFRDFMRAQIDMIPQWIQEHTFEEIDFTQLFNPSSLASNFAKECVDVVQTKIQNNIPEWQEQELKKRLEDFVQSLNDCTESDMQEFNGALDNVKQILQIKTGSRNSAVTLKSLLVGSSNKQGLDEITQNVNELIKQIYQQLLLISEPSIDIMFIIRVLIDWLLSIFGSLKTLLSGNPIGELKAKIATKIQSELKSHLPEQCDTIEEKINEKAGEIISIIDAGLTNEHKSLEDNVNAALQEMQEKKGQMDEELKKIDSDLDKMKKVRNKLLDLIDTIL